MGSDPLVGPTLLIWGDQRRAAPSLKDLFDRDPHRGLASRAAGNHLTFRTGSRVPKRARRGRLGVRRCHRQQRDLFGLSRPFEFAPGVRTCQASM